MKTHLRWLLCAVLLGLAGAQAQNGPPVEKPADDPEIVIAVIDFDNASGQNLPNIGRVANDVLNTYLVGLPGVSVVTRDKLASVLKEQELGTSGLVGNSAKSTKLASLLGADYMVTGSVLQYATEQRRFNSFGVNTLTTFHRMKVSLQIVDLSTARLKFAKTYDLEYKDTASRYSGTYWLEGRERDLLDRLVGLASEDLQKAVIAQTAAGQAGRKIRIPVTTTPAGADIEINGVYVGSTPAEVEIEEGTHELRLSLQGFRLWEKKVKANPGMKVNVSLSPLPPEQTITIEQKIK